MERLVYAEIDSVTEMMRRDKKVLIISDSALFLITTKSNSKWYNQKFNTVCREAIEMYEIEVREGRVSSKYYPQVEK